MIYFTKLIIKILVLSDTFSQTASIIIIITEEDLNKHIDYIHYNPMKHYNVAPKDWKYSSFNKFVQNGYYEQHWCNFEDKYNINELDYE